MKPFAIATAGVAALSVLSIAYVDPATASSLTFDYNASVSVTGELDSEFSAILDSIGVNLDSALNFSDTFSGSWTTDDPTSYLDGEFNIDYDLFSSLTDFDLSAFGITDLDEVLDIDFSGTGSLWSDVTNSSTDFNFSYDSTLKSIAISGYDTDILAACTAGLCETTAFGNFSISTSLFGSDMSVASGEVEIEVITEVPEVESEAKPVSIPEPSPLWGLLGVGAFMLKKKSLKQPCA